MVWIISKCPHCKKIYESGHATISIANPIVSCSNCKEIFISERRMEWSLKTPSERKSYSFMLIWSSFVYGVVVSALMFSLLTYLNLNPINLDAPFNPLLLLFFLCPFVLLFYWYFKYCQNKDIVKSNTRLNNQLYRNQLEKAGLLDRVEQSLANASLEKKRLDQQQKLWEKDT